MRSLSSNDCLQLSRELVDKIPVADAMTNSIGETHVGSGIWRFYSRRYPKGGVAEWNSNADWRREWKIAPELFYAFGEDLFGNQLTLRPDIENVYLWNHENGSFVDLLLDPVTLLETVIESGLDWIDFYNDGSLKVAEQRLVAVPNECHLHWTTPLILGGTVSADNTSVVERSIHLVGHAKLWHQLRDCDPGTIIVPTRKPNL